MIKIGSFFEAHIEKIILVIVSIVCVWLLMTRVIFSPNQVKYGDGKYSPAAIDEQINQKAEELRQKINTPPEDPPPYNPQLPKFVALLESSVTNIDNKIWPQVPYAVEGTSIGSGGKGGKYRLPVVGAVTDIDIEHIRAAAYVPTTAVTAENQYDKAATEPNNVDLITVQAKFDVAGLYQRFKHCFVEDVEKKYSDPCLAEPIFAAVQLQRQELGQDGRWSDWTDIPRTKIDHYGQLFEIVEEADKLPPGRFKVTKLQFENRQLQIDLLQPEAYAMASAKEEWYPPGIHRKFLDIQRKEDAEEARKAREDEQKNNERADSRRSRRTGGIGGIGGITGRAGGVSDMGGGLYGGGMGGDTSRRRTSSRTRSDRGGRGGSSLYDNSGMPGMNDRRRGRRRGSTTEPGGIGIEGYGDMLGMPGDRLTRRGPSMFDVYDEFDKIRLTYMTDLEKMKEPMVFWAHDDTVEPTKTYRYRIRLGVFNPVAGTDQISERDISRKNEVVLWSEFSEVTEPVDIPGRMYFFAKYIREPANEVTVQVSKYVLGYWYSEDFKVNKGEVIGNVVETETETDRQRNQRRTDLNRGMMNPRMAPEMMMDPRMMGYIGQPKEKSVVPETIDYSTGAVLVDTVAVSDRADDKNLTERRYYNMLYSKDGNVIEHMPVRTAYWSKDLRDMYGRISILESEKREPFKSFSTGRRTRPGARPGGEMGEYDDMLYEDMMYEDMGGYSPY